MQIPMDFKPSLRAPSNICRLVWLVTVAMVRLSRSYPERIFAMLGLMIELFVCAIKHNCLRKYLRMGDIDLDYSINKPLDDSMRS